MQDISAKIIAYIKRNKVVLLLVFLGLGLLILANNCYDKGTGLIPAHSTIIRLVGSILLSLSFFVFFAKQKRILFANVGMLVLLVFSAELLFFFFLGMPDKRTFDFALPDFKRTHPFYSLGYYAPADTVMYEDKIIDGDTIFSVHYTIGHNHERITPEHDSLKNKYALFFGCSIGYGYGLEDNQTLAYHFQKYSDYNAYNFAFQGTGTNHMLARLEHNNIRDSIPMNEKEGIGVYVFYWDHIRRAIGSMHRYTDWLYNSPYYEMVDDKIVRNKTFKDGRSFISGMYETFYQSSILNYFDLDFPMSLKTHHLELISEMIVASKKKYIEQFGNDDFLVVVYPTYDEKTEEFDELMALLKKRNIEVIDLDKDFDYDWSYAIHAQEAHPNAMCNDTVSRLLLEKIEDRVKR